MSATKEGKRKIKLSIGDRIFVTINGLMLTLFFIIIMYPLLYIVSASFSDPGAVSTGEMILWPVRPSIDGYEFIFGYDDIWTGYGNTLFYTVFGTTVNIAVTIPCAYALSRKDLMGRGFVLLLFMITMYISGGLIPGYLNVYQLGLVNTRTYILIGGAMSVYNCIVSRAFFSSSIPWELHEAARIDGANDFTVFFKIILPLSKAIIVVMILYYGVGRWNSYFTEMIYLQDRAMFPLQLFLREILINGRITPEQTIGMTVEEAEMLLKRAEMADRIKYGVIIVSTIPMLILYPMVQRFFEKGVMIGSVKG